MKQQELLHMLTALLVLSIVISFSKLLQKNFAALGVALFFAAIILLVTWGARNLAAHSLDANVEHETWFWSQYGFRKAWHTLSPVPLGIILPLVFAAFSIGALKCMALVTYNTSARKHRAARRFGYYSFTEMTDWHTALIGAAGIGAALLLAFASYFIPGLEGLPKLATYYAFWNLIPVSKLDGAQIIYGSRILWTTLALVTIIMTLATFIIA